MVAAAKEHDFQDFFGVIDDPRLDRCKTHALIDILFLCVAGTVVGCEGPSDRGCWVPRCRYRAVPRCRFTQAPRFRFNEGPRRGR